MLIDNVNITKKLYEVLLPLLIIMIRIEADVYFSRKCKYFKMKKIKINRSNLISEIITEIYDKH